MFEGIAPDSSTVDATGGFRTRVGRHAPIIRESSVHDQVGQPPFISTQAQTTSDSASAAYCQLSYELFQRMEPPQFRGDSDEDAYEFLTSCHEMLAAVSLVSPEGVRFVALQLQGTAREWWKVYLWSRPPGSPPAEWDEFSGAF